MLRCVGYACFSPSSGVAPVCRRPTIQRRVASYVVVPSGAAHWQRIPRTCARARRPSRLLARRCSLLRRSRTFARATVQRWPGDASSTKHKLRGPLADRCGNPEGALDPATRLLIARRRGRALRKPNSQYYSVRDGALSWRLAGSTELRWPAPPAYHRAASHGAWGAACGGPMYFPFYFHVRPRDHRTRDACVGVAVRRARGPVGAQRKPCELRILAACWGGELRKRHSTIPTPPSVARGVKLCDD